MRKLLLAATLVLGLGVVSLAPVASSQEGYEPTVTVCVSAQAGTIDAEGRVTLIGPPRCTPPGVVVDIHVDDTLITQARSLEDGSFSSTFNIPPGSARLVLRVGSDQVVVPINAAPARSRSVPDRSGSVGVIALVLLATLLGAAAFGWKRVAVPARARRKAQAQPTDGPPLIDTARFVPQRPELVGTGPERREEETSG